MRAPDRERPARSFPATRHSALAAIRGSDPEQRKRALDSLALAYWRPVYAYLRLHWHKAHEEAADLTQEFFAQLLLKDLLRRFDPQRARLRTFLRLTIDGLAANQERSERRRKRASGTSARTFDFDDARAHVDVATVEAPDVLFEREWTRALFAVAIARLRQRCAGAGKQLHFSLLEEYDLGAGERTSYAELARRAGIAVTDVTNRLAWARRELRECVLELLHETTATDSEYREDVRAVLGLPRA